MLADVIKVDWEYEDKINIAITVGMFMKSEVIGGVRMYPYVSVEGSRYYLEG